MDTSASMSPSDPLLMYLWPRICEELGYLTAEQQGEDARRRYLQSLPTMMPATCKGPKVSSGRFYSFIQGFRAWGETHHTKLLVIAFPPIRLGWARSIGDLWLDSNLPPHPVVPTVASASPVSATKASATSAASSSSSSSSAATYSSSAASSSPVASATTSSAKTSPSAASSSSAASGAASGGVAALVQGATKVAKSFAGAKDQVRAATTEEMFRSKNTLHAVGRMLVNDTLARHLRMVGLVANPLATDFGLAYHELKGVGETQQWYAGWAHWHAMCGSVAPCAL